MMPVSIGVVSVLQDGRRKKYTVSEGIFYFENNKATLLADNIEDVDTIDLKRAREAEARAREKLLNSVKDGDIHRAEVALMKAINRINAKESDE